MKLLKVIYILFFLISCRSNNNNNIELDINRLTSNKIIFSKDIKITHYGVDTLICNFFDSQCKMVVYIDSTSCNSCVLNALNLWSDFINYAEPFDGALKYYFIFNPPKGENIRLSIKSNIFDYPILIDSLGEFERLNPHLPKNRAMHTFLLDENNNVILVGNPLTNKQIEKMFYKEVEKRLK